MKKRIVIMVCDLCPDDKAAWRSVTIGGLGGHPLKRDLCQSHLEDLVHPQLGPGSSERVLRALKGTEKAVKTAKREPLECPECGRPCANPQGLSIHRKSRHGVPGTSRASRRVEAA